MEEESATTSSTTQNLTTPSSSQFYSSGLLTPKCRLENKRCCRNVLYPWYYSYCSYDSLLWRFSTLPSFLNLSSKLQVTRHVFKRGLSLGSFKIHLAHISIIVFSD